MRLRYALICLSLFVSCKNSTEKSDTSWKSDVDFFEADTTKIDSVVCNQDSIDSVRIVDLEANKMKTLRLFNQKKNSASFDYQNVELESDGNVMISCVVIGDIFQSNERYAIVGYNLNNMDLYVKVYRSMAEQWKEVLNTVVGPLNFVGAIPGPVDQIFEFEDIGGDSLKDLLIVKSMWMMHTGFIADGWILKNDSFIKVKGFDEIVSPEYCRQDSTIYSYISTGCADMAMHFEEYKIVDYRAKKITEVDCNLCEYENKGYGEIRINNKKPFKVKIKEAYKYVPRYFSEAVKAKVDYVY